ncbi:MAG: ATP-dependent protease LonB [Candidatus Diapherotrites archaeon]|nr:ATP-dependent protease LonB [Candidatus Diapherotrites archaeon]
MPSKNLKLKKKPGLGAKKAAKQSAPAAGESGIQKTFAYEDTSEIVVPKRLIDQIIGQDDSVKIVRKAAAQKRNVLLVGLPGTGKSLLAQAMSEILPVQKLEDVLIYPNEEDQNNPKVRVVKAGDGKKILDEASLDGKRASDSMRMVSFILPLGWMIIASILWQLKWYSDIIFAALLLIGAFLLVGLSVGSQMRGKENVVAPKLLINNLGKKTAPFFEATGSRAGALLGDVRHDPLQSGGLGTPAHLRVEPGYIHRASGGVLFLDEIATLSYKSQQELLSAMQEKKYPITGQSENSSGAMTRTDPVPCDFVLVAAGGYDDLMKVHPALRSRVRGYGYELYMNLDMDDNDENRYRLAQFVAQEVVKDKKIPHFDRGAVDEIIFEARRRAERKGKLTLKLRDLGGLVRASGDVAREKGHSLVVREDVYEAKLSSKTLERQMVDKAIEMKRDYEVYLTKGSVVGRVNGLAVFGDGSAGSIIPIEAAVAPSSSKSEGRVIATGKLGEIAKEAVQNVSVLFKKISGTTFSTQDMHIQFLQTYEGVEGDSASVSIATAVISAIEKIPVRQELAMTGSLSVRGEVLPVGGISSKIVAAIHAGFKEVIIPRANMRDIVISKEELAKIKIIPVSNLSEVLKVAFESGAKRNNLLKILDGIISASAQKTAVIKKTGAKAI